MVKYSRQREAIKACLASRYDHPTAETVYLTVQKEYPNISLGTVYRNLSFLAEQGDIQKIVTEDGADRFDFNTTPHCHFHCRVCDRVMDIDLPVDDELIEKAAEGFSGKIEGCKIQFTGVCPNCSQ